MKPAAAATAIFLGAPQTIHTRLQTLAQSAEAAINPSVAVNTFRSSFSRTLTLSSSPCLLLISEGRWYYATKSMWTNNMVWIHTVEAIDSTDKGKAGFFQVKKLFKEKLPLRRLRTLSRFAIRRRRSLSRIAVAHGAP